MSAFAVYLLGILICVVGIIIAAYLLDVPAAWIAIGAAAALIAAALIARRRARRRESTLS